MKQWHLLGLLPLAVACGSGHSGQGELISADLRQGINHPSLLALQDEIESVEYVPLETTDDPASLLDGVSEYALTGDYIYVSPVKEQRIVQFDRQGHFIKTLIPFGQGPGEFSNYLTGIQADEENNRLYLFSANQTGVYTLEGEFIQNLNHGYQTVYQRKVGQDRFASVAFPYVPFQGGSYGLGIFTGAGDTLAVKNDFSSPLVSPEKVGFTIGMIAAFSGRQQSLLFKTGCNDTVFRISATEIRPVCVLNLRNSDREIVRCLDATDFSSLHQEWEGNKDIFVSDLFETPRSYYFRCRYDGRHYVVSIDKKTGKMLTERCEQPENILKLSDANLLFGMLGTRSYHRFPIWGRMEKDRLVQVITPYELSLYESKSTLTVPNELKKITMDGNPVFIVYRLRES